MLTAVKQYTPDKQNKVINNIEHYHFAVYMPNKLIKSVKHIISNNIKMYGLSYSKHFIKRMYQHTSNRSFNNNNICISNIKTADIIKVDSINTRVIKVLIRYNISNSKNLYLCIALDNTCKIITVYTDKANRQYNKTELLKVCNYKQL